MIQSVHTLLSTLIIRGGWQGKLKTFFLFINRITCFVVSLILCVCFEVRLLVFFKSYGKGLSAVG